MDNRIIEQSKEKLLQSRAELADLLAEQDHTEAVELDQSRLGRLSRMDAMQSQQIALETKRRNQRRLAAIDGALRRLETGDFGYCFVCDEEIAVERLAFDPTLTRCIKCAS